MTADELVTRKLLSDRGPQRTGAPTVDDADALEACQRGSVDERTHGLARLLCPQSAYVELVRHVGRRAREEMHARLGRCCGDGPLRGGAQTGERDAQAQPARREHLGRFAFDRGNRPVNTVIRRPDRISDCERCVLRKRLEGPQGMFGTDGVLDRRAELAALREEIRTARRRERERPVSSAAEPERDRRLGAAVEHAVSAERALRALEPLPLSAPLAVGDPVQTADDGVHGTIAAIEGESAEVLAPGGLRLRIPLARLRPAPQRSTSSTPPEPSVHFFASSPADVPDELDVRGLRAQETREAVRAFVDAAALAGLESVRVVHGRGTGALRTAVREELASHKLVDSQQPDSANGATVVHLA